jgi:hypothetical protein
MFFPFARERRDHDSGKRIRNDRHSDLDAVVGAWAFILFRQRIEAVVRAQGSTSIGAFGVTVHREGAGPHLVQLPCPPVCARFLLGGTSDKVPTVTNCRTQLSETGTNHIIWHRRINRGYVEHPTQRSDKMRYLLLVLCTTLLSLNSFARFISPRNPLDLLVLFLLFFILRSFALDESIALSKFLPDVRQGFEQWLIRFRNIGKNRVAFIFNI